MNEQARNLYDSFYSFNEDDNACVFDEDGYKVACEEMIGIIRKIVHKLQMINNNDFVIEDYITKDIDSQTVITTVPVYFIFVKMFSTVFLNDLVFVE